MHYALCTMHLHPEVNNSRKIYNLNITYEQLGEHIQKKFRHCLERRGFQGLPKLFGVLFIEGGNSLIFFTGIVQGYCV